MKRYELIESYDQSCTVQKGIQIRCFSVEAFEHLQRKGAIIAGSVHGKGKHTLGTVSIDGMEMDYQGLEYNRHLYKPAGYIQCEDETYLVVLKRSWIKLLLLLLLLLLLVCGSLFYFLNRESGPDLEPGLQQFQAAKGLPDDYGKTSFIIPAYNKINMQADTDQAGAALWNPEKNQVYFKFVIELRSNHSVIYESRLVPPGMAIRSITFNRSFAKGEYPITIRVKTFDVTDYKQELNSGEVQTVLVALESKK